MANEANHNTLPWVQGNHLELALPMKIVYFTPNGKITQDYEPPTGSTICVEFQSNVNALCFTPTVEGNVLHVTDNGELPAGIYSVNIHVTEPNGDKRCSKLKNSIVVYDDNAETVDEFDDFPEWAEGAILQGSVFYNTSGGVVQDAVLYTEQSLTIEQKAQARTNIGAGTYSKASSGIPSTDLAQSVQTSLRKADTALQSSDMVALTNNEIDTIWNTSMS